MSATVSERAGIDQQDSNLDQFQGDFDIDPHEIARLEERARVRDKQVEGLENCVADIAEHLADLMQARRDLLYNPRSRDSNRRSPETRIRLALGGLKHSASMARFYAKGL